MRKSLFGQSLMLGAVGVVVIGCGGGGGGGGGTTSSSIHVIAPVGQAISIAGNAPWHAQIINGNRVICGVFGGLPGAYTNGKLKAMPLTIPGGTNYVPSFMAGQIVYGTYSKGNFSWNTQTNAVADTGGKQAVAVSPSGTFVGFVTSGAGSVLHVATNTEVALPVNQITAVSDSGTGVCMSNQQQFRFSASGALAKSPLQGTSSSEPFSIHQINLNGLLVGEFGSLPGMWQANANKPTALGIPGGNTGVADTMNTGGAAGGSYQATSTSPSFALLWPQGNHQPNVFVDVNGQFPLAGGAVLNAIVALDPNSLDFIGLVTNGNGSQSIQAFAVH